MDVSLRSAYDDCLELLADSVDLLSRSLSLTTSSSSYSTDSGAATSAFSSTQNVLTWLSAALTNQDTCQEGFTEVNGGGSVKNLMSAKLKDLSELVSNCLAIYSASNGNDDFAGVPIGNRRRLLKHDDQSEKHGENFPHWLSRKDRMLLDMPVASIQADIIVSKDGNGTVKTIAEAIKKAPEHSDRRTIIYVRAGK